MDKETSLGEVQLYNTGSDFVTEYTIYEQPQPFTAVHTVLKIRHLVHHRHQLL